MGGGQGSSGCPSPRASGWHVAMATGLGDLQIGVFQSDLLLGADRLEPGDRRRYERFFLELVRQRGFPLHSASLWNALFFGWDLEEGVYLGRGLRATLAQS